MPEVFLNSSFFQPNHAKFRIFGLVLLLSFATALTTMPVQAQSQDPPLLVTLSDELNRAFSQLGKTNPAANLPAATAQKETSKAADKKPAAAPPQPPYFISYSISDASEVSIRAQYGALTDSSDSHSRVGNVVVRIGDPSLDNTHGTHHSSASNGVQIPLGDDGKAIAHSLWQVTNSGYAKALDSYLRVKTESQVRAKEEDSSADFSQEKPQVSIGAPAPPPV